MSGWLETRVRWRALLDPNTGFRQRCASALTHPVTVVALAVLLLNDVLFKSLWPEFVGDRQAQRLGVDGVRAAAIGVLTVVSLLAETRVPRRHRGLPHTLGCRCCTRLSIRSSRYTTGSCGAFLSPLAGPLGPHWTSLTRW